MTHRTAPAPAPAPAHPRGFRSAAARRLGVGAAALVGVSLLGGAVSVWTGPNTWADAWTAEATLAAPWPMVLVQGGAAALAVRGRGRPALAGSGVLLLAALLSAVSGFFDGQLARADLGAGYVAMQLGVVVVAGTTAVLAAQRLRELVGS
jgi:hypothetical protein